MRADAQMAPHQPPVGVGNEGEQRMDIGISQPGALLSAGTVDKRIGRAQVQRARPDSPDLVEPQIVAFKPRLAFARVAPFDRTDRFDSCAPT